MDCLHNIDAETALLGAAITDFAVAQQVAALPDGLFTGQRHQAVHRAVKRLIARGKTPDLVTVNAEVQCDFDDTACLASMMQAGIIPSMAGQYEAMLREAQTRRTLLDIGQRLVADAANPAASASALQASAMDVLRGADDAAESADMRDTMLALSDSLSTEKARRMQVGIPDLDRLTGGVQPGQLIYIGARPAVGKTALGLCMARHIAAHSGPVLVVSLEMGLEEIGARYMADASGVDLDRLSTGRMAEEDFTAVTARYQALSELPIRISTRANTPLLVRREAVRMQARGGLKMIVIDYIQLMRCDTSRGSRYEEVTEISRELKLMAMELRVPVVAMCQLNRQSDKGYGRAGKSPPSMAEARDSGALEQDANVFITLFEPEEPDHLSDEWYLYSVFKANGMAWQVLNVEKNRQGRTGKINVGFDKPHMRYKCLATTGDKEAAP